MNRWEALAEGWTWVRPRVLFIRSNSGVLFFGTIVATVGLGAVLGPGLWMWVAAAVIGLFEVLWLGYSDAAPKRRWKLRHHSIFFVIIVLMCAVGLPATATTSGSGGQLPAVIGWLLLTVLLVAAAMFLRITMLAVARSNGPLVAVLKGGASPRRTRLELWYGYTGSGAFGMALCALVLADAKVWFYVVACGMAAVVVTCMWVVVHWRALGEAQKEGGKLLVRQATLSCILCLALIVQAFDGSAGSVPLSVAVTSGVMLVPTVSEFVTAVMKVHRQRGLATKRASRATVSVVRSDAASMGDQR